MEGIARVRAALERATGTPLNVVDEKLSASDEERAADAEKAKELRELRRQRDVERGERATNIERGQIDSARRGVEQAEAALKKAEVALADARRRGAFVDDLKPLDLEVEAARIQLAKVKQASEDLLTRLANSPSSAIE